MVRTARRNVKHSADIRVNNKKRIIQYLRMAPATKKNIANALSLSPATVSCLCNALVAEGILQAESTDNSEGGRIPNELSLIPNSRCALSLNLVERDIITLALVGLTGNIIRQEHLDYRWATSMSELAKFCGDSMRRILQSEGIQSEAVMGVGVAIPGVELQPDGKVYNSSNYMLNEQMVKHELANHCGFPIYIENEANAAAFALFQEGHLRDASLEDVIYFYIGDGIGVGIVANGQLVKGTHNAGAEINHLPIGVRNYECVCHNTGCIDTEISIVGFQRKYFDDKGMEHPPNRYGFQIFEDDACNGEKIASDIIAENGEIMGKTIAVLCQLFDPPKIYIGGFDQAMFDLLYPYIRKELDKRSVFNDHFRYEVLFDNGFHSMITRGCFHVVLDNWMP